MAKQLIEVDGRYFFIDDDTLEIKEVHIDKPVLDSAIKDEIMRKLLRLLKA